MYINRYYQYIYMHWYNTNKENNALNKEKLFSNVSNLQTNLFGIDSPNNGPTPRGQMVNSRLQISKGHQNTISEPTAVVEYYIYNVR